MIFKDDSKYIAHTYKRFPLHLVSGKGSILMDSKGKKYIDMGSGIGVNIFGVHDGVWMKAVKKQIDLIQHTSNLYYTAPSVKLAELLCKKTNMKKVFFSNSGAEANECAIKIMRKYAQDKKGSDYYNIITLKNSFHGRTLATLSATGQEQFHSLFTPLPTGFINVDANDIQALKRAVDENKCAGIMIECVQGEGGVNALDESFVKEIRRLCDEKDILLCTDEVQSGNGRTGMMYSYMNYSISVDLITTAKGLGGGLPIGACIMGESCENTLTPSTHGSTFGANPIACAGAFSIVKRLNDKLFESVREKSKYIFDELDNAKGVESISGMGLMIGIKSSKDVGDVIKTCMQNGVLPLSAKDKLRLLPPLNIPFNVLKRGVEIIKDALS